MIITSPLPTVCFILALDPWFCCVRKKNIVPLLTTEDENNGAINVGTEVVWIRKILGELGFPIEVLTVVYCFRVQFRLLTIMLHIVRQSMSRFMLII